MTELGNSEGTAHKEERLELSAIARRFEGTLGICSMRVDGPETILEVGGDEVFPAASVIKIAIALEVFCQVEEGAIALGERIALRASDKVIGSGVLAELGEGLSPTIGDLVYLAMAISDNTAANLLVDRIGIFSVNRRLASLGLKKTRLSGKILVHETKSGPPAIEDFGATPSATTDDGDDGRGERSPVTARELVHLLRCVHRREGLPPPACDALLEILQKTQTASSIRRGARSALPRSDAGASLPQDRLDPRRRERGWHRRDGARGVRRRAPQQGLARSPSDARQRRPRRARRGITRRLQGDARGVTPFPPIRYSRLRWEGGA